MSPPASCAIFMISHIVARSRWASCWASSASYRIRGIEFQDLTSRNEVRSAPQVWAEFLLLDQFARGFDALVTEIIDQRFAKQSADRKVGLTRQEVQHALNRQVLVNLAEQIAGVESKVSGGTKVLVTDGRNNFLAADLDQGGKALLGAAVRPPRLPTSNGMAACSRISPAKSAIDG